MKLYVVVAAYKGVVDTVNVLSTENKANGAEARLREQYGIDRDCPECSDNDVKSFEVELDGIGDEAAVII